MPKLISYDSLRNEIMKKKTTFWNSIDYFIAFDIINSIEKIEDLPATLEFFSDSDRAFCSNCKTVFDDVSYYHDSGKINLFNFCPVCGKHFSK